MHSCHHYDDLDTSARKKILQGFLVKARANAKIVLSSVDDEQGYTDLFSMLLNGRQIKNVMKMAQFMAAEE